MPKLQPSIILNKSATHPLELSDNFHINLWSENNEYKWTIALWEKGKEGYDLRFIGERPFDPRVNWSNFKLLIELGQKILNIKFEEETHLD